MSDLPTIAVIGIHQDAHDLEVEIKAANAIAARIDASGTFDALTHTDLALRLAGRESIVVEDAVLGPGRRLLDDGRSMWSQAQPDQAVPVLEDAIASLREALMVGVPGRDLSDAYMVLGMAHRDLGNAEASTAAFEAAIAVTPTRNPDPATYPPDVVAAFDRLRTDLLADSTSIEVDASITGARVLLDGAPAGTAPVTLTGVTPGEHVVVGIGADGSRGAALVDVPSDADEVVRLALGPPSLGAAGSSSLARSRQVASVYRAIGDRAEVDLVLLVGVVDGELKLQLYATNASVFSAPISVPFSGDASDEAAVAVPRALEVIGADGSLPVDKTVANAIPVDVAANDLLARLLLAPDTLPGAAEEPVTNGRPAWLVPTVAGLGALVVGGVVVGIATGGGDHGTITVVLP